MIERPIMIKLLDVLKSYGGYAGEKTLHTDLNLSATNRVIASQEMMEHLNEAADKGWVAWRLGALRDRQWHLTPAGRAALSDLELGG